jgi:hypothetical protein
MKAPNHRGRFRQGGPMDYPELQLADPDQVHEMQRMAEEDGAVLQWIIYHAPPHSMTYDERHPQFLARPMLYDFVGHHNSIMLPYVMIGDTVEELRAVLRKYAVNLNIKSFTDPAAIEVWGPDPKTFVAGPREK